MKMVKLTPLTMLMIRGSFGWHVMEVDLGWVLVFVDPRFLVVFADLRCLLVVVVVKVLSTIHTTTTTESFKIAISR